MPDTDPSRTDPEESATSAGNEGARGSRGQANSGAQPGNPQDGESARSERDPDLRDADAQGGGGIASDSSRSK